MAVDEQTVVVTHPFHPRAGQRLRVERVERARGQPTSVDVRVSDGVVRLPASWTDMASEDAFVRRAGGRAFLSLIDLIAVADLIDTLTRQGV